MAHRQRELVLDVRRLLDEVGRREVEESVEGGDCVVAMYSRQRRAWT